MRYVVLLVTGIMCRQGAPPPPSAPAACTMTADADVFAFLRTHDCIFASGDNAPPQVDVRLVRGVEDHESIAFRVDFENHGSAPAVLELVLHDQRLCFEMTSEMPSYTCELFEKAPAGVDSRARVILPPHVTARVAGLEFRKHELGERYEKSGAIAAFWVPKRRGTYDVRVEVPVPHPITLQATVTLP